MHYGPLSGTTSFQYAKHFVRVRQVENPRISTHKIDGAGLEWRFFAAIYFYRQPPTNLKIMHNINVVEPEIMMMDSAFRHNVDFELGFAEFGLS